MATDLAARTQVWGALDSLENLKKGGRIGNARAMLASVLSIKPIIEITGGKVEEGGKQFLYGKNGPNFEKRAVTTGARRNLETIITQGVKAGEEVRIN